MRSDESVRLQVLDTLAWALFANGLDEQAIAECEAARESADEAGRASIDALLAELRAGIRAAPRRLEEARSRLAPLEEVVNERRTWAFADPEDRTWHFLLSGYVAAHEALADPARDPIDGISPTHGWGIARRKAWAERVEGLTVSGPEAAGRWREAEANPFGLHHVHGNVFEWCADVYDPEYYGRGAEEDPLDAPAPDEPPGARNRVSRGGSFRSTSYSARSAFRQNDPPDLAVSEVGLRPARALDDGS